MFSVLFFFFCCWEISWKVFGLWNDSMRFSFFCLKFFLVFSHPTTELTNHLVHSSPRRNEWSTIFSMEISQTRRPLSILIRSSSRCITPVRRNSIDFVRLEKRKFYFSKIFAASVDEWENRLKKRQISIENEVKVPIRLSTNIASVSFSRSIFKFSFSFVQIKFIAIDCFHHAGACRKTYKLNYFPHLFLYIKGTRGYQYFGPTITLDLISFVEKIRHPIRRIVTENELLDFFSQHEVFHLWNSHRFQIDFSLISVFYFSSFQFFWFHSTAISFVVRSNSVETYRIRWDQSVHDENK